jgi:hypothetical protein
METTHKVSNATFFCSVLHHCAGAVYNTATAFEKMTTRKGAKKVLNSCRIIHQGQELSLLKHYFDRHLAGFGVEVPPSKLFRLVGDWARDQLEAVGVKVGPRPL